MRPWRRKAARTMVGERERRSSPIDATARGKHTKHKHNSSPGRYIGRLLTIEETALWSKFAPRLRGPNMANTFANGTGLFVSGRRRAQCRAIHVKLARGGRRLGQSPTKFRGCRRSKLLARFVTKRAMENPWSSPPPFVCYVGWKPIASIA